MFCNKLYDLTPIFDAENVMELNTQIKVSIKHIIIAIRSCLALVAAAAVLYTHLLLLMWVGFNVVKLGI